jgi:hypothetical protein
MHGPDRNAMNDHSDRKDTVNGSQHASPTTAPSRRRRFRRSRDAGVREGATVEALQEALAELVLLREENARLSAAAHQPPSLGRLMGQVRSLGTEQDDCDDCADEAAQMIVEGVVLRESLLEVCRELERSMATLKARLTAMGTEVESLALMRSRHDDEAAVTGPVLQDVSAGTRGG